MNAMKEETKNDFSDLHLSPSLLRALNKAGYAHPYPIQEQAIPAILRGQDVLGIAKTGSGKTASYVLPVLTNWQGSAQAKNRHVDVLVLVPTRELAVQVAGVFEQFATALPGHIKTLAVHGGVSINPQMQKLQGVSILVATPGRLLELVGSNAVHLSAIDTLVLDEADKMLNLGFEEEMNQILALLPNDRQNLLFSATLNAQVDSVHRLLLDDPVVIKIAAEEDNIDLIQQSAYLVSEERRGPLLRYLIKSQELQQVLVFVSSVFKADNVANKLRKNGIQATAIHGKKSQGARTEALKKFKAGNMRVLVATDLLARGIDIQFLPCVINYELPRSPKDYIHRIGRTGRAESPGQAIAFVTLESRHHFKIIQKKMGKWLKLEHTDELDLKGY